MYQRLLNKRSGRRTSGPDFCTWLKAAILLLVTLSGSLSAAETQTQTQTQKETNAILIGGAWGSSSDDSTAWRLSATKPWKRKWFEGGRAHLTGYWEASVALFENDVESTSTDPSAEQGAAYLWNVAFAPVFRLQFTLPARNGNGKNGQALIQPFMDLGVGVSFMSDREFRTGKERSRPLGSYFQFEDRGAVGVKVRRWEIAYQRMHYSNLNLARDNFGIDAHLLLIRRALRP
jgi:hypothetical protein